MTSTVEICLEHLIKLLMLFDFNPNESRKQLAINFIEQKLNAIGKTIAVEKKFIIHDAQLFIRIEHQNQYQEFIFGSISKLLIFSKSPQPSCMNSVLGAFFATKRLGRYNVITSPLFLRLSEEFVKPINEKNEDLRSYDDDEDNDDDEDDDHNEPKKRQSNLPGSSSQAPEAPKAQERRRGDGSSKRTKRVAQNDESTTTVEKKRKVDNNAAPLPEDSSQELIDLGMEELENDDIQIQKNGKNGTCIENLSSEIMPLTLLQPVEKCENTIGRQDDVEINGIQETERVEELQEENEEQVHEAGGEENGEMEGIQEPERVEKLQKGGGNEQEAGGDEHVEMEEIEEPERVEELQEENEEQVHEAGGEENLETGEIQAPDNVEFTVASVEELQEKEEENEGGGEENGLEDNDEIEIDEPLCSEAMNEANGEELQRSGDHEGIEDDEQEEMEPSQATARRIGRSHKRGRRGNKGAKITSTQRKQQMHEEKLEKQTKNSMCYALKNFIDFAQNEEREKYDSEKVDKILERIEQISKKYHHASQPPKYPASHRKYVQLGENLHANDHSLYFEDTLTRVFKFKDEDLEELWSQNQCTAQRNIGSFNHLPHDFHGKLMIELDSKSKDITKKVKELPLLRKNYIYNLTKMFKTTVPPPDVKRGEDDADLSNNFYYALNVKSKKEVHSEQFENAVRKPAIIVVENFGEACGIDRKSFSMEAFEKAAPDVLVDVLFQPPHPVETNCDAFGKMKWGVVGIKCRMPISELVRRMEKLQKEAKEMLEKLMTSDDVERTVEELLEGMLSGQVFPSEFEEAVERKVLDKWFKKIYWVPFGTNVDFVDEKVWKLQFEELNKFPEFLKHSNPDNILNILGEEMLGVNSPQAYIKSPGSRTVAHMENHLMESLNWNVGNATCIWFSIPYKYWGRIQKIVKKQNIPYLSQSYWPIVSKMIEDKIPVTMVEQKPGDLVYLGTGTFHFVQSEGFTVNVSYNIGFPTFTQLATSMISHAHNIMSRNPSVVPFEATMWKIAEKKLYCNDPAIFDVVKSFLIRSLTNIEIYINHISDYGKEMKELIQEEQGIIVCTDCRTECFNVIRAFESKRREDALFFCSRCNPTASDMKDRREIFYIRYSLETLQKWFDEYRYKIAYSQALIVA